MTMLIIMIKSGPATVMMMANQHIDDDDHDENDNNDDND